MNSYQDGLTPNNHMKILQQNLSFIKTEEIKFETPSRKTCSSSRGHISSFLPPCRICGDKASGFHYGANTCEACKGFFRRSIVREQKDEDFEYRCLNGQNCVLNAGKLRLCAYCRYKKCLAIGMSKRAIKQGRYTHARRTQYINEVKSSSDVKPYPSALTNVDNTDALSIVDNLMAIQDKHTSHVQKLDLNHNEQMNNKFPEHMESQVLQNIVDTFENSVTLMVEFMRHIPGFMQLDLHDQSGLLKGSHSDFFLLGEIRTSLFDNCLSSHAEYFYKFPVHHLYSFSKLQDVYKFIAKSKELNITKEEITLLRAIAVLSTDRADLHNPDKVEEIQWSCVNCLRLLSTRMYVNPNQRLWQLLDRITALRTLSPDY